MENVEFCEADQNTRTCITRYQVAAGQMLGVQGTASIVNKEEITVYDVLKLYYTKTSTNNTNKSKSTLTQMEMIKIGSTGCGGGTY